MAGALYGGHVDWEPGRSAPSRNVAAASAATTAIVVSRALIGPPGGRAAATAAATPSPQCGSRSDPACGYAT